MIAQNEILTRIGIVLASLVDTIGPVYISNPYPVTNDSRANLCFLFPVDDTGEKIERGRGASQDVLDRRLTVNIVTASDNLGQSTVSLIAAYVALVEDVDLGGMLCSQLDDLTINFGLFKAETRLQTAAATLTLKYRAKRGTFELSRRTA
jgi:hypothetical protein